MWQNMRAYRTIPTHTLMLNCCWCLERITLWGFSFAHWCWLWILMMPSLPKRASPCKSHWWNKEMLINSLNKTSIKVLSHSILSAVTQWLNFSGKMLIWTVILVLVEELVCSAEDEVTHIRFLPYNRSVIRAKDVAYLNIFLAYSKGFWWRRVAPGITEFLPFVHRLIF
jgi:diacylglycerol kinase